MFAALLLTAMQLRAEQAPLRIMPLGDSITQGYTGSYRQPLWSALRKYGRDVDFVGSLSRGYAGGSEPTGFDPDHEGHWGWRADQVLTNIDDWAKRARPDIVLLHIGTNDIGSGGGIAETVGEIEGIIRKLRGHNPRVHILLAAIIPVAHESVTERWARFNGGLVGLAAELDAPASRVVMVDQFDGFNAALDTYDGVHPNEAGNLKMASKWFTSLKPLLVEPDP